MHWSLFSGLVTSGLVFACYCCCGYCYFNSVGMVWIRFTFVFIMFCGILGCGWVLLFFELFIWLSFAVVGLLLS